MTAYKFLNRTDKDTVTTVTLARPDFHNALDAALIEELTRCFEEISEDDSVRAVVLAGEGRSFCAGADIGPGRRDGRRGRPGRRGRRGGRRC